MSTPHGSGSHVVLPRSNPQHSHRFKFHRATCAVVRGVVLCLAVTMPAWACRQRALPVRPGSFAPPAWWCGAKRSCLGVASPARACRAEGLPGSTRELLPRSGGPAALRRCEAAAVRLLVDGGVLFMGWRPAELLAEL